MKVLSMELCRGGPAAPEPVWVVAPELREALR